MLEHCGLYSVSSSHQQRDNITAVTSTLAPHCMQMYIWLCTALYLLCGGTLQMHAALQSSLLVFLWSTSCYFAVWPNEAKVLDTHQPDYRINRDRQTIEDEDVLRCVNN